MFKIRITNFGYTSVFHFIVYFYITNSDILLTFCLILDDHIRWIYIYLETELFIKRRLYITYYICGMQKRAWLFFSRTLTIEIHIIYTNILVPNMQTLQWIKLLKLTNIKRFWSSFEFYILCYIVLLLTSIHAFCKKKI